MDTILGPIGDGTDADLSSPDEIGSRPILPNLFYSIPETRRLLGDISHATVYRLIAAGRLDARKLLGRTVVSDHSIGKLASELPRVGAR